MNHVTFNDPIKKLSNLSFGEPSKHLLLSLTSEKSLQSPLFEWDFKSEQALQLADNSDVFNRLEKEPNLLPFKRFRLNIKSPAHVGDPKDAIKCWIDHGSSFEFCALLIWGRVHSLLGLDFQNREIYCVNYIKGHDLDVDIASPHGLGIDKDKSPGFFLFETLAWFIREYTSPQNFVASVTPDKKGKSVEWLQTRTHYVLLNRHHPANDKAVMKGAKVAPGEEYIQRRAHSRRAHARILRSPRFRNKVGQTIRVKACWVGPDEWEQFGSIYRMANLNPTKK